VSSPKPGLPAGCLRLLRQAVINKGRLNAFPFEMGVARILEARGYLEKVAEASFMVTPKAARAAVKLVKYRIKVQTWSVVEAEVEVEAPTERDARELALSKGHAAHGKPGARGYITKNKTTILEVLP
jgi:hypothetical protein